MGAQRRQRQRRRRRCSVQFVCPSANFNNTFARRAALHGVGLTCVRESVTGEERWSENLWLIILKKQQQQITQTRVVLLCPAGAHQQNRHQCELRLHNTHDDTTLTHFSLPHHPHPLTTFHPPNPHPHFPECKIFDPQQTKTTTKTKQKNMMIPLNIYLNQSICTLFLPSAPPLHKHHPLSLCSHSKSKFHTHTHTDTITMTNKHNKHDQNSNTDTHDIAVFGTTCHTHAPRVQETDLL